MIMSSTNRGYVILFSMNYATYISVAIFLAYISFIKIHSVQQ